MNQKRTGTAPMMDGRMAQHPASGAGMPGGVPDDQQVAEENAGDM